MSKVPKKLLLALTTLLALLLGPLGAQETSEGSEETAPAAESAPAPAPADADPDDIPGDIGENVSADNSLSFPVDI